MRLLTPADLVRIGVAPLEALAALPESLAVLNRSLTSFAATVARLDTLAQRLDRLTEPLEAPLTALAPRLEALVPLLDEELISSLPAVLDAVNRNAVPALEVIGQTQAQVASIAASVDRLMAVVDETLVRLQDLPGVGLVSRLRGRAGAPASVVATGSPGPIGTPGATGSAGAAAAPAPAAGGSVNSDIMATPESQGGHHDHDRRPSG